MRLSTIKILGVKINSTVAPKVLNHISSRIKKNLKTFIVTPNPEIVLAAQKDSELLKILNASDISLPDGVGLVYAGKFLGLKGPKSVIRGREFMLELCDYAFKNKLKIFLLGGKKGVAQKAATNLQKHFNNLPRRLASLRSGQAGLTIKQFSGPHLDLNALPLSQKDKKLNNVAIKKINSFMPEILFVGFGCPKQEKWLYHNWDKLNIKVGMVVGGAFDYIGGTAKVPPKWLSGLGLEWLWRLLNSPRRFKRIVNATILFPFKLFRLTLRENTK